MQIEQNRFEKYCSKNDAVDSTASFLRMELLAEMRKDHGDTQATLATQLGVSLPTARA